MAACAGPFPVGRGRGVLDAYHCSARSTNYSGINDIEKRVKLRPPLVHRIGLS